MNDPDSLTSIASTFKVYRIPSLDMSSTEAALLRRRSLTEGVKPIRTSVTEESSPHKDVLKHYNVKHEKKGKKSKSKHHESLRRVDEPSGDKKREKHRSEKKGEIAIKSPLALATSESGDEIDRYALYIESNDDPVGKPLEWGIKLIRSESMEDFFSALSALGVRREDVLIGVIVHLKKKYPNIYDAIECANVNEFVEDSEVDWFGGELKAVYVEKSGQHRSIQERDFIQACRQGRFDLVAKWLG